MSVEIVKADYANAQHAAHIVEMLDNYALDPMGGGQGLLEEVKVNLVAELSKRSFAFSVLAYKGENVLGLANCFEVFSTFKAKPLVNIHDLIVKKEARGQGVSQKILDFIEQEARGRGACKITLEVLSGNKVAQNSYTKFGFQGYTLDSDKGQALFWEKPLTR